MELLLDKGIGIPTSKARARTAEPRKITVHVLEIVDCINAIFARLIKLDSTTALTRRELATAAALDTETTTIATALGTATTMKIGTTIQIAAVAIGANTTITAGLRNYGRRR